MRKAKLNKGVIVVFLIIAILLLFILIITKAASVTFALIFVCLSALPLGLLMAARDSLRKPFIHWALIALVAFVVVSTVDEAHRIDYPVLVVATELAILMMIIADLIFNDNIGRVPRKGFDALIQEGLAKVGLSLVALLVLGLFFNAAQRLGSAQYTLMLVFSAVLLYSLYFSGKSRTPTGAIVALLAGSAWNIAASVYAFYAAEASWLGSIVLAYWFLATAYKLGRCALPDYEDEAAATSVRPTQALKRTPDGAA